MVSLTEIIDGARQYHREIDTGLLNKAYAYSARMHEGQRRKSGEPYLVHPVNVASIIAQLRLDCASMCAALLHDVVEDTAVSDADISEEFGKEIAFLVAGVTKLSKLDFFSREDRKAESFRKMLLAMEHDIRVLLIKLSDRLDNMRSLGHMAIDKQDRIARETMEIYAPLAARLGIQWMKDELEDLCFQYLYPGPYAELSERLQSMSRDSEKFVHNLARDITEALASGGLNTEVSGGLKRPFSIYRKMRENQCEFEQIHDLLRFRVLVERVEDCYAALGVLHSCWIPVPGRFKDHIALPKSNMYRSLHTTVIGPRARRMDLQIRTADMQRTAEMGISAHWRYEKSRATLDRSTVSKFSWLRNLMRYQEEVADPQEFIDGVKIDLFSDEVYVFTPKGDTRIFPRGATPVDFAYSIHSEVGDHCTGARVDGSLVPLSYRLHNGDTVEIVTSAKQRPSKEWLGFVATARARSRIRVFIRAEERKRAIRLGRGLLERQMRKRGLSFSRVVKSGEMERTGRQFRCSTVDNLFAQVGFGKLDLEQVSNAVCLMDGAQNAENLRPSMVEKAVEKVIRRAGSDDVVVDDPGAALVRFARCCNPVPGDAITGWLTRGRGVTVHRHGCERALELAPERRVNVSWSGSAKDPHRVSLRVLSADRPGILAHISSEFTESGINISEAVCRSLRDGRALNTFRFSVSDVAVLNSLMRSIASIEGVFDVERG